MAKASRVTAAKPKAAAASKKARVVPAKTRPAANGSVISQLDDMTVAQLSEVIEQATDLKREKMAGERKSFMDEVRSKAAGLGLSVAELLGNTPAKRGRPAGSGEKRASPPVKFRGPNPDDTWSGRGRTPRWLMALEAEGKQRADFAV